MKTLEKGDILYLRNNLYGGTWYYRYEVESTTKTHAILSNAKTKVQINGKGAYAKNPLVYVYEYRRYD